MYLDLSTLLITEINIGILLITEIDIILRSKYKYKCIFILPFIYNIRLFFIYI